MSIAQNYKRLRQEIPDRPYFKRTRKTFERIKGLDLPNVDMKYLSMGMTNSYRIAVEEGSNMVRIGTAIFGERRYR